MVVCCSLMYCFHAGATVIPIVVMLCLLPWCPETPRFLMLVTKNEDEAEKGEMEE